VSKRTRVSVQSVYRLWIEAGRMAGSCVVLVFLILPATVRAQYLENVLYSFCPAGGACVDGANPYAAVIADTQGNLYGTTYQGGAHGGGTVFELSPPATPGGAWTEKVLYSFCSQTNCSDGAQPFGPVLLDPHGNLYGTAEFGGNPNVPLCGSSGCGVAFELSPSAGGSWQYSLLYTFSGVDGMSPSSGVIFDLAQQNLYGVGHSGGPLDGGIVFELNPTTGGTTPWTETILYPFGDDDQPVGGLAIDSQGNLYGTTIFYAQYNGGVFELTQSPPGSGQWVENTLYESQPPDVGDYLGVLAFDAQHNIYATGAEVGPGGAGGVVQLTPSVSGGLWNENIIYAFNQNNNAPTGHYPAAGVIFDSRGNLFGTTAYGGNQACVFTGCGVVFELNPPNGGGPWTNTVLYAFSGPDGQNPFASLLPDGHGNYYGTTEAGGAFGNGVVFELSPVPTNTVVTTNVNAPTYGQPVSFTATVGTTVQYGSQVTGTVQFQINGSNFGAPVTLVSGQATSGSIANLSPPSQSITAIYSGDVFHTGSTGNLTANVNQQTPSLTVVSVNPASENSGTGTPTLVTAALTWTGNGNPPTGAVTFGSTAGGAFTETPSCGPTSATTITCTQSFTPAVTDAPAAYTMSAHYNGDTNYRAAGSTQPNNFSIIQQKVTPVVVVTTVIPNWIPYGSGWGTVVAAMISWAGTGPAPTSNGGPLLTFSSTAPGVFVPELCLGRTSPMVCGAIFTPVSTDAVGTYTITSTYAGDNNYTSASSTQVNNIGIAVDIPAIRVTPNSLNIPYSSTVAVTLTATFTGAGQHDAAPTGAVAFSTPTGAFSGQSCNTVADVMTCTVRYTPTGKLAVGYYGNYFRVSIAAAGDYGSAECFASFTVTKSH
jgi:uncharacterized repeat protein (TIGR03803 family)